MAGFRRLARRRVPRYPRCSPPLMAVLLLAALVTVRWWQTSRLPAPPEVLQEGIHRVRRVVDGDTLLLTDGARVRLVGVDCPETVEREHPAEPWGWEASRFTGRFVFQDGGAVRLQFDRERVDRYGRFLAYVWVGGRMLNEELVRRGLARARTEFHYAESMKRRFSRAQEEAQALGRGIWSGAPPGTGGL